MHARNNGAMRRKKAALTAFHAQCLKKTYGGHEAWVQAKADYEQWKVGASNFEHTVSGAVAEVNDIWELRLSSGGVAMFCRPNSHAPATQSVPPGCLRHRRRRTRTALRAGPPLCPASVLCPSRFSPLGVLPLAGRVAEQAHMNGRVGIGTTGSHDPPRSLRTARRVRAE